ncbi:MAG: 5-formyltetrahydrofolate cyclo-ligase [Candidatus Omnitrophica bacterium]|nr:5-formyltetrahydrofolate cyclo-ligase [Candidatus Omnitrophota bacterium]
MCYVAFDGEVETRAILAQALSDGKRVAVPAIARRPRRLLAVEILDPERDLRRKGPFGIPHPVRARERRLDPRRLGLVIVPAVAFDRKGRRLGRGGGYFDRFLSRLPPAVSRVGLAFGFQVVRELPSEPHDEPVSSIVTERVIIHCSRS